MSTRKALRDLLGHKECSALKLHESISTGSITTMSDADLSETVKCTTRTTLHTAHMTPSPRLAQLDTKSLSVARRAELLASLWATPSRRPLMKQLLTDDALMGEPAVLSKAATLLDLPRRQRQLERRVETLVARGAGAKALRASRAAAADAREAARHVPACFSASRSFNEVLQRCLARLSAPRLEFDLLFFEPKPFAAVCDIAHPHPKLWQLEHFQPMVYGEPPPAGTLLADVATMSASTLTDLLVRHPRLAEAYSVVRSKVHPDALSSASKAALARAMPLCDALWHYEELNSPEVASAIDARLASGESLTGNAAANNFGKLLERLLLFRRLGVSFWHRLMPHAGELLEQLQAQSTAALSGRVAPLQRLAAVALANAGAAAGSLAVPEAVAHSALTGGLRVAVLGDASSSMQVAINSACICGAMLAACFDAELVFFASRSFTANSVGGGTPRTVEDVLQVCQEVRANGTTSPAAALDHFYSRKTQIDLFVLVSDEGENTKSRQGLSFAQLFERYVREVNPSARCAFISFLDARDEGYMLRDMRGVVERGGEAMAGKLPPQHRFDPHRPDLSKFDGLVSELLQTARESNPLLDALAADARARAEAEAHEAEAEAAAPEAGETEQGPAPPPPSRCLSAPPLNEAPTPEKGAPTPPAPPPTRQATVAVDDEAVVAEGGDEEANEEVASQAGTEEFEEPPPLLEGWYGAITSSSEC